MSNDAALSPFRLGPGGPRPHMTEYSADYERFVSFKEFPRPLRGSAAWRKRLDELARDLMENPIPGLAELHDFQIRSKKIVGVFEVLPGRSLDAVVKELNGLPAPLWIDVVQQLLETVAQAHERGEIELFFDPRSIYVWPHQGEVWTGIAACEFHVGREHETREWVHWLRQLAILWFYLATGEWVPSYYSLVERDLKKIPQLQASPPLLEFFEQLFHSDVEKRVFRLDRLRDLIDACDERLGDAKIPTRALRVLGRLPHERHCLSWMVPEEELPSRYTLGADGRDARRPSSIPARDELSGDDVTLHILPPEQIAGKNLIRLCDQAERLHRRPNPDYPILPITDFRETRGCRIFTEAAPDGVSLQQILERAGSGIALLPGLIAARKIDTALRRCERAGLTIPSLNPADVFLVSTSRTPLSLEDLSWMSDPEAYRARLRVLPTEFLHRQDPAHYQNDDKAGQIQEIMGGRQNAHFAELVARMLSHRDLSAPAVKSALQGASARRSALLAELELSLRNPDRKPRILLKPLHFPVGALASAAAVTIGLAFGVVTTLRQSPPAVDPSNPYFADGESPPPARIVKPPENLFPVSGENADPPPNLLQLLEAESAGGGRQEEGE